jgi:3',5'-cyclic AMP phosphodiesterase CpdA
MINIIQISDLHFGSNDAYITGELQKTLLNLDPNLVIVSGDLTTRARTKEFIAAKEFLSPLPGEQIIVPGNHDISLYNVIRRFFKPLERFEEIISKDVDPHFINNDAVIIGLNSSRSFTIKGGNISTRQIKKVKLILKDIPPEAVRVVVTHHPMQLMDGKILQQLVELGIRVFVSGHMHKSGSSSISYDIGGLRQEIVFVKAGTATSIRYRNESNSFNKLVIDGLKLSVGTYTWKSPEGHFSIADEKHYDLFG